MPPQAPHPIEATPDLPADKEQDQDPFMIQPPNIRRLMGALRA